MAAPYATAEGRSYPLVVRVVQDWESRVWANMLPGLSLGTAEPGGKWRFQCVGQFGSYSEERQRDVALIGTYVGDGPGQRHRQATAE